MNTLLNKDKCKFLGYLDQDLSIYSFSPTFNRLFPKSGNTHKMTFRQKVRFMKMLQYGYFVYLVVNKDLQVVASCVISSGENNRYPFSNKGDYIIGPYYTVPLFRGNGIMKKLIFFLLKKYSENNSKFFAHVRNDNFASIEVLKKCGFEFIGFYKTSLFRRKFIVNKNGFMSVFMRK